MRTPVFHSIPKWQLSGVNTWAVNVAIAMSGDELFEHIILVTAAEYSHIIELDDAGIPYALLELPFGSERSDEWNALKNFVEANAPCIYIPHYEFHQKCSGADFLHECQGMCSSAQ